MVLGREKTLHGMPGQGNEPWRSAGPLEKGYRLDRTFANNIERKSPRGVKPRCPAIQSTNSPGGNYPDRRVRRRGGKTFLGGRGESVLRKKEEM